MKAMKTGTKLFVLLAAVLALGCGEDEDSDGVTMTLKGSDTAPGGSSLTVGATSLRLKVYEAWVSPNGDCSNPVQVLDKPNADYAEFAGGIEIGKGEVDPGTYECVIMVMSDYIKFTPATTETNCTAGTEYTAEVCHGGATMEFPDKTSDSCVGSQEQKVAVYLSTFSTATSGSSGHNGFESPGSDGDSTRGFKLSSSLAVDGDTSNTFVVDVSDKVDGSGGTCEMQPPEFSFQ